MLLLAHAVYAVDDLNPGITFLAAQLLMSMPLFSDVNSQSLLSGYFHECKPYQCDTQPIKPGFVPHVTSIHARTCCQ